jgi:hypothetical protein
VARALAQFPPDTWLTQLEAFASSPSLYSKITGVQLSLRLLPFCPAPLLQGCLGYLTRFAASPVYRLKKATAEALV